MRNKKIKELENGENLKIVFNQTDKRVFQLLSRELKKLNVGIATWHLTLQFKSIQFQQFMYLSIHHQNRSGLYLNCSNSEENYTLSHTF